ncbi:N-acetyltransferase [Mycetocola reblochoni]|uniref:N-acetyltransferase n=1 Tax=Mycetocola reblochoni TaxID=331618 RepID=A0A3L6ZLR6_9MICO|nr:N-acetyltransferase [Mycetocola reblochoni]
MRPSPTARLRFRELVQGDLDELAALLGDPEAMAYYPEPKTREQTADWIERTAVSQREHGHTLWAIEGHDGEFLGDCGITWQSYNGIAVREIGYHLVRARQGQGLATEAARSCLELARREFPGETLTAIIHPDNVASRRVAEKLGMIHIADDHAHPWITRTVMGLVLPSR